MARKFGFERRPSATAGLALAVACAVALVAGCSTTGPSPAASAAPSGSPAESAAADAAARQFCTDQGGLLVDREAVWNTNADRSAWLRLAGRQTFCEFQSGTGDQTTRISVDLLTLSSEQPTLAAIAYLSKVPPTVPEHAGANPGSYNCNTGLGGAATFGNSAAGGGWVAEREPVYTVMNECFFADGSAIDVFGLLYHATGTIRGADLAPLFRYQPHGRIPAVWDVPRH
jgi:putative hemolysin